MEKKVGIVISITLVLLTSVFCGCIGENSSPEAEFTYTLAPDIIYQAGYNFTDMSTDDGTIISWNWSFGDGNTSDEQNPMYYYTADGLYDVTLNVTDDKNAAGAITKQILVVTLQPLPLPPVANFTYAPIEGITNETNITFNASNSINYSSIVSYYWEFGDGVNITEINVTTIHKYASAGAYKVNMTITDEYDQADTYSKDITVS